MNTDAGTGSPHPTGESLSAYTDAELSRAPRAAVESHLRTCDLCASTVLAYRELRRVLRRSPERPLPARRGALPWERTAPTSTWPPAAPGAWAPW